jgi:hypothetical protein
MATATDTAIPSPLASLKPRSASLSASARLPRQKSSAPCHAMRIRWIQLLFAPNRFRSPYGARG